VTWGLLGAFGAALAYGVGAVLQAVAARAVPTAEGLDPRLLLRLLRSWPYLLGLALDGAGFVLSLVAVRTLPLFVVQSVVASFLAVTAVVGAVVLRTPLRRADAVGLGVVVLGLVLVGLSAAEGAAVDVTRADQWGVLAGTAALGLLAVPAGRLRGPRGAAALGSVAGLAFGATSVAARMLPGPLPSADLGATAATLAASPAAYTLVAAGALALLAYSSALQRGSVTQATAPLVLGETVAPAVVGLLVLGDAPRAGFGGVAALGFGLAVAGAVALSRHGEAAASDGARGPGA
jgi:drug/metabolite transporter (DMT)-like permease